MYKTKFAILVGLLLALLFLCSMDAEAAPSTNYSTTVSMRPTASTYGLQVINKTPQVSATWTEDFTLEVPDGYFAIFIANKPYYEVRTSHSFVKGSVSYEYKLVLNGVEYELSQSGWYMPSEYMEIETASIICHMTLTGSMHEDSLADDYKGYVYVSSDTSSVDYFYGTEDMFDDATLSQLVNSSNSKLSSIIAYIKSLNENVNNYYPVFSEKFSAMNNYLSSINNYIKSLNEKVNNYYPVFSEKFSAMNNYLSSINNYLASMNNRFDMNITVLSNKLKTWKDELSLQFQNWESTMVSKFDELIESLTRGYDSSGGNTTNSELSSSLNSWEAAEGQTMDSAKINVSNYDTSTVFNFAPALISSLSLVTTFATGFLRASGDFTTAISVMFSLAFVSVLVGLVRFVRG